MNVTVPKTNFVTVCGFSRKVRVTCLLYQYDDPIGCSDYQLYFMYDPVVLSGKVS